MGHSSKIATCCYCGTRAALVLKGRVQHELACGSCGAPLHELKGLPLKTSRAQYKAHPAPSQFAHQPQTEKRKKKKRRKQKSFTRIAMRELFDVVEDLFD